MTPFSSLQPNLKALCFGVFTISFIAQSAALQCGETQCDTGFDHCCVQTYFSPRSLCCSSENSYWALKGTGIGVGVMALLVFMCLVYSSWKRYARRRERSRMTSNDNSSDTPPDYDTVKTTLDKELPAYYSLYPIPIATASGAKDDASPPGYEMNDSSKNVESSKAELKEEILSVDVTLPV